MTDIFGIMAGGLALIASTMPSMLALRIAAAGSNIAFIGYGLLLGVTPLWVLHGMLLPLNLFHFWREASLALRRRRGRA